MRQGDWSLTVSQRRPACVLDPALLLGHACGPVLALRLSRVLEPWLTRGFWQAIDASELFLRRAATGGGELLWPDAQALRSWIGLRHGTDAGSWCLRWVGDNLAESQLQDAAEPDLLGRYERLAEALQARLPSAAGAPGWLHGLDRLETAADAVALSACLDGAFVLCPACVDEHGTPWPVQALERAGVPVHAIEAQPARGLFADERRLMREALARAALAAVAERLPPLAVVHVLLNGAVGQWAPVGRTDAHCRLLPDAPAGAWPHALADRHDEAAIPADGPCDVWAGAQAWWYAL